MSTVLPVKMSLLIFDGFLHDSSLFHFKTFAVFLFDRFVLGIDVSEDEMELGIRPALVRAEHDRVRRLVVEMGQVHVWLMTQKLDVTTPAVLTGLEKNEQSFGKENAMTFNCSSRRTWILLRKMGIIMMLL